MSSSDRPLGGPGAYDNPWPSWKFASFSLSQMGKFGKFFFSQPSRPTTLMLEENLPMVAPTFGAQPSPADGNGVEVTWIGHATCLVRLAGYTLLTDPVFAKHCSPVPMPRLARIRPPAIPLENLPKIDAVVYSHDHYDHMDLGSAAKIEAAHRPHWFVPAGNEKHFRSLKLPVDRIHPLGWWESTVIHSPQEGSPGLRFTLVPAQHWSRRFMSDRNSVLWGGWAVSTTTAGSSFYFAGDTGFTRETPPCENWQPTAVDPTVDPGLSDPTLGELFHAIGERCGPFDVSLIPIGAYCPRELLCPQHIDPVEAVAVHQRVRTAFSLGIHWGTFILSMEHPFAPPEELAAAAARAKLSPTAFTTTAHGLTRIYSRTADAPIVVEAPSGVATACAVAASYSTSDVRAADSSAEAAPLCGTFKC